MRTRNKLGQEPPQKQQYTLSQDPATMNFNEAVGVLVHNPTYTEALDFYYGEHWKGGEYWVGPRLDADDEDGADVLDQIEASLVKHPALEQVVDRKKDALLGRPGTWSVTVRRALAVVTELNPETNEEEEVTEEPSDEEQALIDEANQALVNWYDEKEVLDVLDDAELDMELGGRGLLRLMVSEASLRELEDGTTVFPAGEDFERCMNAIWPVHMPADMAVVLRDSVTMRDVGVFVYEVTDIITGAPTQMAEITWLDDDGNTHVKSVGIQQPAKGSVDKPMPVDWGEGVLELQGRLTMFEMRTRKALITEPILSNQKLLNMSLTMMGMNAVLGGFLERVILNGQKPGEWVTDENAPDGTGRRFVPGSYKTGARTTQWLVPKQLGTDPSTKAPIFGNVDIKWRDPVDPETFIKTSHDAYTNILHGAHQLHVLISGDAVASGESRKQARDDYEKSLKKDKARLDKAGSWMLETVLHWAAVLAGTPGKFAGLRVVYDTKVDAGPIAAIDRAAMREEVNDLLRSRENYMVETRVTDDPEAEEARIVEEQSDTDPINEVRQRREAAEQLKGQLAAEETNGQGEEDTDVRRGTGRSKPSLKPKAGGA